MEITELNDAPCGVLGIRPARLNSHLHRLDCAFDISLELAHVRNPAVRTQVWFQTNHLVEHANRVVIIPDLNIRVREDSSGCGRVDVNLCGPLSDITRL